MVISDQNIKHGLSSEKTWASLLAQVLMVLVGKWKKFGHVSVEKKVTL